MKLVLITLLLGLVAADDEFFTHKQAMMKWMKWKTLIGCYGEDNMETWHVLHKKALKKCMGMPAPELELHKLMEPYKLIQSMLRGMKDHQGEHMMKMVTMMKAKAQMNQGVQQQQQPLTMAYVPYPMMPQNQQSGVDDEMQMMMKMMKKMMMKKFLKKMMHGMGHMSEDEEEEDEDDMKMVRGLSNMEPDMTDFFQEFLKSSQAAKRFKRDADLADLGDKLTEKLQVAMKKWNAKMSNISCYMKEMKWVDDNMNLDENLLMADFDNYKWDDQWLLQKSKEDTKKCLDVAQSIPKYVAEDFYSEKWGRIKMFHFCTKKHQAYTCMKYDIKKMLEKHFSPLKDLVDQTDIEENMLLELVHGILEDSMGN